MKFFNLILVSSYPFHYCVYPYGALGTLVPFLPLCYQYSTLRNQLPRSVAPNTSFPRQGTPAGESEMYAPSTSSLGHLCSTLEGTLHGCVHGLYLLRPSVFGHFPCYISALPNPDSEPEYLLSKHDNTTSSPTQCVRSFDLRNATLSCMIPFCKSMKFIETKVPAMKLQGFNQFLR